MRRALSCIVTVILLFTACGKQNKHGSVITIAGSGIMGNTNDNGTAASFANLMALTVTPDGCLYIADSHNNMVRKVTTGGNVETVAGNGNAGDQDGNGLSSSFFYPAAITSDNKGNVFVADTHNNLIRKITFKGTVTTLAGRMAKKDSTSHVRPEFDNPMGIAADSAGNLYVSDSFHNKIKKISVGGKVTTIAGTGGDPGANNGAGSKATFYIPEGITVDNKGDLYVADTYNNMIRKVNAEGVVTTLAGNLKKGAKDGKGALASFSRPTGIIMDKTGDIYVADTGNSLIRKITPDGTVTTVAGQKKRGMQNGKLKEALFNKPMGIALDKEGNLFVADYLNNMVRKITF